MSEGPATSIGRDSVQTLIVNLIATAVGVVTGIVVAKALGPIGKGQFSGLQLLQNGVGAVAGGIGASITYLLTKRARQMSDLRLPLAALLAILTILTVAGVCAWGARFGFNPTLVIFALSIPAVIVLSWQQPLLLGLNQVRSLNVQTIGFAVGLLAAVMAAVALHRGVVGAMAAWAGCTYIAALVVLARAIVASRGRGTLRFSEAFGALVHFGARSGLNGVLGFFNYRTDSLVLIGFLGAAGFGVYSVAVSAGELMFRISRSIAIASTYRISSADPKTSAATTAKAIRVSTAAIVAAAVVLYVTAPWLIALLYGQSFAGAAAALRVLLPGIVAFASAGLFSPFFAYQLGRPMFVVYMSIAMIAIQMGLCVWLVPRFGLIGAAAGSSATYLVAAVYSTWYFCRITGLAPADVWIARREDVTSLRQLVRRGDPSDRGSTVR